MALTIYDIAEEAGVSTATVSRVLNGHANVSKKMRVRVLKAAEALNYQPHVSAQSLARQRTQLVAAVLPVMVNYFYMAILRGMQEALAAEDLDLLVYAAPRPWEVDGQLRRAAQKGRAEGLLLVSTPLTKRQVQRLKASKQPVVLVDAVHPAFESLSVDNVKGGYLATRHLIAQGRRRIGHLTIAAGPPAAVARCAGYEQALREAGCPVDETLIAASEEHPYACVAEAGCAAMNRLLRRTPPPDAVFAATDVQALGALWALREAGLRVPEDVAVVGFDDIEVSRHVGLSTLRQPMHEMGRLAIEKILLHLQHPGRPTSQTIFMPRLIERASSGAGGGLGLVG